MGEWIWISFLNEVDLDLDLNVLERVDLDLDLKVRLDLDLDWKLPGFARLCTSGITSTLLLMCVYTNCLAEVLRTVTRPRIPIRVCLSVLPMC